MVYSVCFTRDCVLTTNQFNSYIQKMVTFLDVTIKHFLIWKKKYDSNYLLRCGNTSTESLGEKRTSKIIFHTYSNFFMIRNKNLRQTLPIPIAYPKHESKNSVFDVHCPRSPFESAFWCLETLSTKHFGFDTSICTNKQKFQLNERHFVSKTR